MAKKDPDNIGGVKHKVRPAPAGIGSTDDLQLEDLSERIPDAASALSAIDNALEQHKFEQQERERERNRPRGYCGC